MLVLGKDVADGVVLGMVAEYAAVEQVAEELVSGQAIGCPTAFTWYPLLYFALL